MTNYKFLSTKFIYLRSSGENSSVAKNPHDAFYKKADLSHHNEQTRSRRMCLCHYIGKYDGDCIKYASQAKHTADIHTLVQKYCTYSLSSVEPKHYEALLMQILNPISHLTKITIFLINSGAITEMLQVILVVILLAIWLIFSIVFLIAVSQEFMYDRKHMIRKQDHSKHNLEYHESHRKEYCK